MTFPYLGSFVGFIELHGFCDLCVYVPIECMEFVEMGVDCGGGLLWNQGWDHNCDC